MIKVYMKIGEQKEGAQFEGERVIFIGSINSTRSQEEAAEYTYWPIDFKGERDGMPSYPDPMEIVGKSRHLQILELRSGGPMEDRVHGVVVDDFEEAMRIDVFRPRVQVDRVLHDTVDTVARTFGDTDDDRQNRVRYYRNASPDARARVNDLVRWLGRECSFRYTPGELYTLIQTRTLERLNPEEFEEKVRPGEDGRLLDLEW